ncbi:methyl acetate hydrolase [Paraburkholderia sp. EB58]|jgi:CubicO group peptidase (beta-lactamase class C family)|uniref:serine hydrolase domain-containing protein n=1 Tax=Paraburkholderia sp. EB58 TaxID=3035125 RepID=UPI003D222A34
MMRELYDVIQTAVERQDVPFAVAMVGDRGGVRWSGSAGEARPGMAAASDTIFRIYSMTKAVGSTAAMILMDRRGKLDPDTPVAEILPEFVNKQVLEGFDAEGKPLMRPPRKQATVRHLATHTSGLTYEYWNLELQRYMESTGQPSIVSGLREGLDYPLMFDPGDRWEYGIGIDWLGQVVEKVDGRAIDDFCHDELFQPLGMQDTRFEVEPDMAPRLSSVRMRGEDGLFANFELAPPSRPAFYGMGHALYSTAPDYMRFLRMYLNKGQLDGHRILSEAGLSRLLTNQIGDTSTALLKTAAPSITADAEFFPGRKKSHSMGFQRIDEDVPGMRSAGSQFWAGVCNTHFWFDPKKDVIGIIMTQTLPFVEPRFMGLYETFERGVYRTLAK